MNRVTITGADDNTPISALADLSQEFLFVEWGILVSMKQEGASRFPSRQWIDAFCRVAGQECMDVSMHVCGEWARRILRGTMDWFQLPEVRIVADRVQLNTHAEPHISCVAMFDWIAARSDKQFIIQLDGVNDHLLDAAVSRGLNAAGLFDCSHGAGILPVEWPRPRHCEVYHGYAGGLGPDNVVAQISKIQGAIPGSLPFWIDMEGRVRNSAEQLDLAKVRSVLEACAPLVSR